MFKKLDFLREIHNSVAPLIMEIDKIFTEMFLFLQVGLPSELLSFTIGK